jgi:glycosyltransferase involved in cell wall biosynthesis
MLTRSNWHTEPRSNRYAYATRFAKHLPVLFVQPDLTERAHQFEKTEVENVTILHVGDTFGNSGADFLDKVIRKVGFKRPLIWIYNEEFIHYVIRVQHLFKIYHATEDYFAPDPGVKLVFDHQIATVKSLIESADLLVAASQNVANNYVRFGRYGGPVAVVPNGCDFEYWHQTAAHRFFPQASCRPVAFYQGEINARLDFHLIHNLIHCRPDWDFWFCGPLDPRAPDAFDHHRAGRRQVEWKPLWKKLLDHPNFVYYGNVGLEKIAELAKSAHVGLLPFVDDVIIRDSWPLKAFEYVACGLGVVTVEIDALKTFPDQFKIAKTAEAFAEAMEGFATDRSDCAVVRHRLDLARLQSYNLRFEKLLQEIARAMEAHYSPNRRLNILFLYDDRYTHIMTVGEHVAAFQKYSKNQFLFVPGTKNLQMPDGNNFPEAWDLSTFDVVVVHYSVRLSHKDYIHQGLAERLATFVGLKVLFMQDEYENTETARKWLDRIGFDAVFTCVPNCGREHIYPAARFPRTEFFQTLTGFVPEHDSIERFSRPMADRLLRIAYRSHELPVHYGQLGREKYQIGVDVRHFAEEQGIPVDIEVDAEKKIYGTAWYKFIGSARATLGTESGSNIFDFSGELKALATNLKDEPYEEVYKKYFAAHEGQVRMNQISPKIFEAIRLRTALVLFEGDYSGVVKPDVHFIPLKKNYSNVKEVFKKLEDIAFLEELTTRAYDDVIKPGRYSYKQFVANIDRYIDSRVFGLPRAEIILAPIARKKRGASFEAIPYHSSWEFTLNSKILGGNFQRGQLTQLIASSRRNHRDVAQAENGASILASSEFFLRPHDADYLLRPETESGYAAGRPGGEQWIEIDLGQPRAVEAGRIVWLDSMCFGIDFIVEGRLHLDQDWEQLFAATENQSSKVDFTFAARWMRYLRLSGTRFAGQDRMLIRRFHIFSRLDQAAVPAIEVGRADAEDPFAPGGSGLKRSMKIATRPVPLRVRGMLATQMAAVLAQEEQLPRERRGWTLRRLAWRLLPNSIRSQIVARLRSVK